VSPAPASPRRAYLAALALSRDERERYLATLRFLRRDGWPYDCEQVQRAETRHRTFALRMEKVLAFLRVANARKARS
jgi:hypothetical protein